MHERHNSSIIIYCRCRRQRPKSTVMETHSKFTVYITLILLCFFFKAGKQQSLNMYDFFPVARFAFHTQQSSLLLYVWIFIYTYYLFIVLCYCCYKLIVLFGCRYFALFCFFFHHIFVVVSFVSFLPKRYGQNTPLMPTFRFQIIHYMRANQ